MRYLALACDYDGTLAHHGRVDESTLAAVERLLASGRKFIMVTGRELPELLSIFPHLDLCERVVAENGALLYRPSSRDEKPLVEPPPETFVQALRARGVGPLSAGKVVVASWRPQEVQILETIRDLGLDLQVIFNKDAVMVLPSGVNKATGLAAALDELGLSPHNVAGIGDAENDHAFLGACECSAAVANALPVVKEKVDVVVRGDHGAGVAEFIDELVADDLLGRDSMLARHRLLLGTREDGQEMRISPYGTNLLIAGPSGSGKSTVAAALLERLAEQKYQFCIIDPEGDYENFAGATTLGSAERAPATDGILQLLKNSQTNAVINMVGVPIVDRPSFFLTLLPRLQEMRARTGRPHCLVLDETHHLLPAKWEPGALLLPKGFGGVINITVHPHMIAPGALAAVGMLIAVGKSPRSTLEEFCTGVGQPLPQVSSDDLPPGEVLVWERRGGVAPFRVRVVPSQMERRRHCRKYAEGELPPERSFYFQGPKGKLKLRAQNLFLFLQMAEGVDDETWLYHLRQGDYSRWFSKAIKDDELGKEAAEVEAQKKISAAESRKQIRQAIERHYTIPSSTPMPMPGTDAASRRT
jgi:hydroxymethylpyrimidine pyrophosphatase-like HAD family hydrolase